MKKILISSLSIILFVFAAKAQTAQDSVAIRQAALDYIESQHEVNAARMDRALHPQLAKRTVWHNADDKKDFIKELDKEFMLKVAGSYNRKGDKFPSLPQKEVIILDMMDKTASVKLVADSWIDYMHLVKENGEWKIINVLWQFKDSNKHGYQQTKS